MDDRVKRAQWKLGVVRLALTTMTDPNYDHRHFEEDLSNVRWEVLQVEKLLKDAVEGLKEGIK